MNAVDAYLLPDRNLTDRAVVLVGTLKGLTAGGQTFEGSYEDNRPVGKVAIGK